MYYSGKTFKLTCPIKSLDYDSLHHFIKDKMSMTHVYQPIMVRTLLKSEDGKASKEAIARQFLGIDESQLNYYKAITGRWPHRTLKGHGIVRYDRKGEVYTLLLDDVTAEQKKRLMELCDLRLHEFIDRDPAIRRFRELDKRSSSGSLRYDVFAKSKGVCTACGVLSTEARMHVDHIIPINVGGRDYIDNMQALCYKCNTQKRDRDDTNFLLWHKRLQFRKRGCAMCDGRQHILENGLAYCVLAGSDGTSTVVPRRHATSFMSLISAEQNLCITLADRAIKHLKGQHESITDFDVRFDVPADHYSIKLTPIIRR